MSEVEKQELIDRLFNDHEIRMRVVETAVKEMIIEQRDLRTERKGLRKTIAKMQAALARIQTGLAIFGALWLWIEVRPFGG